METGSEIAAEKEQADVTDAVKFPAFTDSLARQVKKRLGVDKESVKWDNDDEYDFTNPYRGTVVIFNMTRAKGGKELRDGTSIDAERLKDTFKHLGFDVCYKEDQTEKQIFKVLKKESKRDHSHEDCFACVILSHGGSLYLTSKGSHRRVDRIMAVDNQLLIQDLLALFQDSECKTLRGKPKLFFIQACRGDEFDSGVHVHIAKDEVDARPENSIEYRPCPIYKDFLIMYATPPGFYAFRHPETGSWFVQALCKVLSGPSVGIKSLHQLLTAVTRVVATEYQAKGFQFVGNKQTPCFTSMLVKDVYFRPKIKFHPS